MARTEVQMPVIAVAGGGDATGGGTSERHPIGVIVLGEDDVETVVELIGVDASLPCSLRFRFATGYADHDSVRVELTEGAGRSRDDVAIIGVIVYAHDSPMPSGTVLELGLEYDGSTLEARLVHVASGQGKTVWIRLLE